MIICYYNYGELLKRVSNQVLTSKGTLNFKGTLNSQNYAKQT